MVYFKRGCIECGRPFVAHRINHVLCSPRCRIRAWRAVKLLSGEYVYDKRTKGLRRAKATG